MVGLEAFPTRPTRSLCFHGHVKALKKWKNAGFPTVPIHFASGHWQMTRLAGWRVYAHVRSSFCKPDEFPSWSVTILFSLSAFYFSHIEVLVHSRNLAMRTLMNLTLSLINIFRIAKAFWLTLDLLLINQTEEIPVDNRSKA